MKIRIEVEVSVIVKWLANKFMMPLKRKEKDKLNHRRRPMTEVALYKLCHAFDELPLDPVKPFIIEKMRKSILNMCIK